MQSLEPRSKRDLWDDLRAYGNTAVSAARLAGSATSIAARNIGGQLASATTNLINNPGQIWDATRNSLTNFGQNVFNYGQNSVNRVRYWISPTTQPNVP